MEDITEEYLESLKSEKGGWTRKTLESLGVPWPPPKGWKKALLEGRDTPTFNGWTVEAMEKAELIHGPESNKTDTYRLKVEGAHLDVPGWIVGDPEGAELRMKAAEIIRRRLSE